MRQLVNGIADQVRDALKGTGMAATIIVHRAGAEHDVKQMAVVSTDPALGPLVLNTVGEHFGSRRLNVLLGAALVPFFRMADRLINGGPVKVRTEINGCATRGNTDVVIEVAEPDGAAALRMAHFRELVESVTAEEHQFIRNQKDVLAGFAQYERLAG